MDRDGLPVSELVALKDSGGSLHDFPRGLKHEADAIIDVPCDIWIPAARPDVVRADNVARLKTRLVAQGANIPLAPEAEQTLHDKGVIVVPDFIANAGGVICASIEYRGGTQRAAFDYIDEKIRSNTRVVLDESRRTGVTPRIAAEKLAKERVKAATATRRWR
jgi:glutamate dehydrogenase/leucine dehydrogenase